MVQAKWSAAGKKSPTSAEVETFVRGVDLLLRGDLEHFNARIKERQQVIQTALEDVDVRVHLVLAHTSVQQLAPKSEAAASRFLDRINDAGDVASFRSIGQAELHRAATTAVSGSSVTLEVLLRDWGHIKTPYKAFYGRVAASDIATWWEQHQSRLFAKNLRKFIGDTAINAQMQATLVGAPEHFWYFNNGITLLCESVKKKPLGGDDRAQAVLVCEGASVVNGAQTVGTIGRTAKRNLLPFGEAAVVVRLISLEGCPEGFSQEVTKAANTQNRVQKRDFAALDPQQARIAQEMSFDNKVYAYKTGDRVPRGSEGCTIEDATIALACAAEDLRWTVMAKGQLGSLWEDIERPPYKILFNTGTTADDVWGRVQTFRAVDAALLPLQRGDDSRLKQVAVHGNRFTLRQVLRLLSNPAMPADADIPDLVGQVVVATLDAADAALPDSYLAWTFKNVAKCSKLEEALNATLFEGRPVVTRQADGRTQVSVVGQQVLPFG